MRVVWLTSGLLVLFVGLFLVVWPVLDSLPLPGSSGQYFFEFWLAGIPLGFVGMRLLRRGLPPRKGETTRAPEGAVTTRIALRAIAVTHLPGAAFMVLVAVREFIVVYLGAYGMSPTRVMFFVGLAFLGGLGCIGTVGLWSCSKMGRRLTAVYLTCLVPILLMLPENLARANWTPFLLTMLSLCVLVTSAAGRACGLPAPPPSAQRGSVTA